MAKDHKKKKVTEARQAISGTGEDEKAMELEAEMLAQKGVDTRLPLDLTIDAAFLARIPFMGGGIGL